MSSSIADLHICTVVDAYSLQRTLLVEPYRAASPVVPLIWVNDPSALVILLQDVMLQKRDNCTE
jgi:hypothetical protein